jgi:DNA-binding NarL/FixJ family response regulator
VTARDSSPTGSSSERPTRVLLVDDSTEMLAIAGAALVPVCEIVGTATDGQSALAAADTLRPDVVVLDISMPGMSGLDVAAALCAQHSTAAIVFLTIHDDAQIVDAAMKAGGTGYVVKRRLSIDLLEAVQEARAGRSFISPRC